MKERLSIEEAQRGLRIDRHSIDEAILEQSVLFYDVSNNLVLAKEEKDRLKDEMESLGAEISNDKREEFQDDKIKFTEHALKEEVALDKNYIKSKKRYNQSYSDLRKWEAMKEAYMQRSYMLKELARLWSANYYGDTSLSGGNDVKEFAATSNRKKLSVDRKNRNSLKRVKLNNQ